MTWWDRWRMQRGQLASGEMLRFLLLQQRVG